MEDRKYMVKTFSHGKRNCVGFHYPPDWRVRIVQYEGPYSFTSLHRNYYNRVVKRVTMAQISGDDAPELIEGAFRKILEGPEKRMDEIEFDGDWETRVLEDVPEKDFRDQLYNFRRLNICITNNKNQRI